MSDEELFAEWQNTVRIAEWWERERERLRLLMLARWPSGVTEPQQWTGE